MGPRRSGRAPSTNVSADEMRLVSPWGVTIETPAHLGNAFWAQPGKIDRNEKCFTSRKPFVGFRANEIESYTSVSFPGPAPDRVQHHDHESDAGIRLNFIGPEAYKRLSACKAFLVSVDLPGLRPK